MKIKIAVLAAVACFFLYDYVSGFNRICVYQCIDGEVAITIRATDICPLSL